MDEWYKKRKGDVFGSFCDLLLKVGVKIRLVGAKESDEQTMNEKCNALYKRERIDEIIFLLKKGGERGRWWW
jgi:hypothetical protein